jgi:DNA helicase-2/ATP-dependent DNA helicase PcrA
MWSNYQQAIFEAVQKGDSSILVNAVAGSGKTTTLVESIKKVQSGSIIILAFAKKIKDELRARISDQSIVITTLHANGLNVLNNAVIDGRRKKRVTNQWKLLDIAKNFKLTDDYAYSRAVTFLKDYGYPFTGLSIEDILEEQDFDFPQTYTKQEFTSYCEKILEESNKQDSIVDFGDMGYLPLLQNLPFNKYDWIFVDEAQDLNRLQQATIKCMMKRTTKVVAFGDRNQAIYGFRGADKNSFDTLQEMTNAKAFPLSISYRCAKEIISLAKTKVPHIEAFDKAVDGSVQYVHTDRLSLNPLTTALEKRTTIAVVSRYNSQLTKFAFRLADERIPFYFVNSKYAIGLHGLIKKYKTDNLEDLRKSLLQLSIVNDNSESPNQNLSDKISSILSIAGQTHIITVKDLVDEIKKIFNNKEGIPLYTIHGSKGLEFDTVLFLGCDLLPSKYARTQWQLEQEDNLFYVAVTRARNQLIMIEVKQ